MITIKIRKKEFYPGKVPKGARRKEI